MVQLEAQLAGQAPERRRRWRAKLVVGAGLVGALAVSSLAVGGVGDVLRQEVRNGTTGSETEIIGKFDASTGRKGGYVTRQSNTQTGAKAGGGAIYGCRGAAGGTAAGSAPCVRANNLANGFAFEFASSAGPAGLFAVGAATDAPFVTNGTGLVANLNADKVDGLDASQLKGQQGPAGPQGPKGDTGTVDTSNFYDKATSDARFLGAGAKAADSDKLDGKDSTDFIQGTGKAFVARSIVSVQSIVYPDTNFGTIGSVAGIGTFRVGGAIFHPEEECHITFTNESGQPLAIDGNALPNAVVPDGATVTLIKLKDGVRPSGNSRHFAISPTDGGPAMSGGATVIFNRRVECSGSIQALVG